MHRIDDATLLAWLREDAPYGDLTTHALGIGGRPGHLRFGSRRPMRVAATEEAARLVELCGGEAQVVQASGSDVEAGACLLEAAGPAASLLLAWKVAQVAVETASGVATGAARIVAEVRAAGYGTPVACTRKTWPGGRALAVRAVAAGGAVMHRLGLSETLLVFPEHRAFLDLGPRPGDAGPEGELGARLSAVRAAQPEKRLVAETGDPDEAMALAALGVDVLQLERFTPGQMAALRDRLDGAGLRCALAPAGGVTAGNAVAYAAAGADVLVTSAPYLAPPADVQVTVRADLGTCP